MEIPGADPSAAPKAKSKTAAKNEKRKQARKAEQNKEVDIVKELDAKLRMGVTAPPPTTVTAPAAAAPTPDANGGVPPAADVNTATPPPPAAPVAPAPATESEPNEVEKKVRALKKKLRAADDLIAKQTDGSILNADQLAKVAARGEIEAEIARWESLKDVEELVKEVRHLPQGSMQPAAPTAVPYPCSGLTPLTKAHAVKPDRSRSLAKSCARLRSSRSARSREKLSTQV